MVLYLNKKPYTNFHGRILGISTQQNVLWYVFFNFRQLCCGGESVCVYQVEIGPKQLTNVHQPLTQVEGLRDGDNLENETFSEQHKVGFLII